jgi:S-formylglutathione hydrolase FrmB
MMLHPLLTALGKLFIRRHMSRRLDLHLIDSAALGKEMAFSSLSPPVVAETEFTDPHVFYMLHGLGDDHRALDRHGISDRLHDAMTDGGIPPVYLVMPQGDRGFWIDWHDGTRLYESYVVDEVIPRAEQILGLEIPPERRHVMGVSMGGIGALQMGLRRPDLFSSVSSISGPVLDEKQAIEHVKSSFAQWFVNLNRIFGDCTDQEFMESHNPFAIVRRKKNDQHQRIFLTAGRKEKEFFRETSTGYHKFLDENNVAHRWEIFEGGHGWRFWAPVIERAISYATSHQRQDP